MKKSLVATAVLGALAATAQAESNVQIYGVFDIGIGYSQHSLSADPYFPTVMGPLQTKLGDKSVTGMFNGGLSASRLGFKGSEDLGSGLKAIWDLEMGFNPNDGILANAAQSLVDNTKSHPATWNAASSMNGQLFGRQAWMGLSSAELGTITFGRNYSLGSEVVVAYDPMQGSQLFSPFGYSGAYGGGAFTEDFRVDNSVKYKNQFGNFNVGALYKFGGQAGSTDAQSAYQLDGGYDDGTFGIEAAYSKFKDGLNAGPVDPSSGTTPTGKVALTAADTDAWMIAAKYKFGQFLLRGGYEWWKVTAPSNPSFDQATSYFGYPVSSVTAYGANGDRDKKYKIGFVGLTYEFTPSFNLSGAYYDIHQDDFSANGCTSGSDHCSGNNRFYSLVADYKFSKRTDAYAGYMFNKVDGGFEPTGTLHNSNTFIGTGVRHMF